jgi:hypothetical protein
MGVKGLWVAMLVGITLQAVFYTRLVVWQTNWQDVADDVKKRIASDEANLFKVDDSFTSVCGSNSFRSSSHQSLNDTVINCPINNSGFMRARD